MGITGLPGFLKKKCGFLFENIIDLEIFEGEIIGIDTSIYMYKFKKIALSSVLRQTLEREDRNKENPFMKIDIDEVGREILKLFYKSLVLNFIKINILPLFILDGERPQEKKDKAHLERQVSKQNLMNELKELKRKWKKKDETKEKEEKEIEKEEEKENNQLYEEIVQTREKMFWPSEEDFKVLTDFFDHLRVPYVVADGEADNLCAYLATTNYVSAILSIDSDLFAYGVPRVLLDVYFEEGCGNSSKALLIQSSDIYKTLNLTHQQFIDFCLLCGTDYNHGIDKIGPVTALTLIQQHNSLDGLIEKYKEIENFIVFRNNFKNMEIIKKRHTYHHIKYHLLTHQREEGEGKQDGDDSSNKYNFIIDFKKDMVFIPKNKIKQPLIFKPI
jgi:5'-3' exonuclease